MKLVPLGERLIIKKVEAEEKTQSGIVLPSSAKEEPSIAEVLAVGKGILNDDKKKDDVKVGDRVIFAKYGGTDVELDGESYTIIKLADILAIVK